MNDTAIHVKAGLRLPKRYKPWQDCSLSADLLAICFAKEIRTPGAGKRVSLVPWFSENDSRFA